MLFFNLSFDELLVNFDNGSQLAKREKYIPHICPCYKIYRVEVVGLRSSNYTLKVTPFYVYMKFGAIW